MIKYEWMDDDVICVTIVTYAANALQKQTIPLRSCFQAANDVLPDMEFEVVLSGLSNTYSDYVATFEEYQVMMLFTLIYLKFL